MKVTLALAAAVSYLWISSSIADGNDSVAVTIESKLGLGFGKHLVIEGKLIETPEPRDFGSRQESVRIHWINGKQVSPPILISVSTVSLVTKKDHPEVGDWVRLRGYESGGFSGFPKGEKGIVGALFSRSPRMSFKFRHYFSASESRKPKRAEPRVVAGEAEKPAAKTKEPSGDSGETKTSRQCP